MLRITLPKDPESQCPVQWPPVDSSASHTGEAWKWPLPPAAGKGTAGTWCLYTVKYYCAMKNDKAESPVGQWMPLETIMSSEIYQTQA